MGKTVIRPAVDDDNDGITAMSKRCLQEGMITMFVNRTPRFNTLHRLIDSEAIHYVSCSGDEITGLLGVVHFPYRVLGKECRAAYMLDFRVLKEHRGGTTAYRLVRDVVNRLRDSDVDLVIANFLKDNRNSLIFTTGKAMIPDSLRVGENKIFNILPLRKMKTDSRFEISHPEISDIPELIELYRKYSASFKMAPVFDEESFRTLTGNIKGLSLDNFFIARENGKIRAVTAAWDEHYYKSYQVTRVTFSIKAASLLMRFLSLFMKTPRPIMLNEPLRQLSLVLYAHDECPGALETLFRHINNINRGGKYTIIMLYAQADDPLFRIMKKFTGVTVKSDMYIFARDTSVYPELAANTSPVLFHTGMIL